MGPAKGIGAATPAVFDAGRCRHGIGHVAAEVTVITSRHGGVNILREDQGHVALRFAGRTATRSQACTSAAATTARPCSTTPSEIEDMRRFRHDVTQEEM